MGVLQGTNDARQTGRNLEPPQEDLHGGQTRANSGDQHLQQGKEPAVPNLPGGVVRGVEQPPEEVYSNAGDDGGQVAEREDGIQCELLP